MDLGLAGRVYVVSGGSRGLGRATAEALVAEGARVVVGARDEAGVERAAQQLGGPAHAVGVVADLGVAASAQRLVEAAHSAYGGLDGALVSVGGPDRGTALDTGEQAWRDAFDSLFLGALRLTRQVVGALGGEGGSIGYVLSSLGPVPDPRAGRLQRAAARARRPGQDARGRARPARRPRQRAAARADRHRTVAGSWTRRPATPTPPGPRALAGIPLRPLRRAGRVRPGGRLRALPRRVVPHRLDDRGRRRDAAHLVRPAAPARSADRAGSAPASRRQPAWAASAPARRTVSTGTAGVAPSPGAAARPVGDRVAGLPLPLELGAVELGVQAAGGEQLGVGARLDDPAAVDDEDLVGAAARWTAGARSPARCGPPAPRPAPAAPRPPTRSPGARSPRRGSRSTGALSSSRAIAIRCFSPPESR